MSSPEPAHTIFFTLVRSAAGVARAQLLIDSLRTFGGELANCPIWVFEACPQEAPCGDLHGEAVRVLSLPVPEGLRAYPYGDKVFAAARAEALVSEEVSSLVWLASDCLVVNPPLLLQLEQGCQAALRPVHIRNVGLSPEQPLDAFWAGVYQAAGVEDVAASVETFVGGQIIRAYYNSHIYAVDPSARLLHQWFNLFEALVGDRAFQESGCADELHRVFLHQAVFSALLSTQLKAEALRLLPPSYSYPYHFQDRIPAERRAKQLTDLVTIAYEDRTLDPADMDDISVAEPLRSWLSQRVA